MSRIAALGYQVEPGLTEDELRRLEVATGSPLPPDYRGLLGAGLPVGVLPGRTEGFPDWRGDPEGEMSKGRAWVLRAFTFDIEHAGYWPPWWGPRSDSLDDAIDLATERLAAAAPLVRVYGHRFLPVEPCAAGNPVFSVWQAADTMIYGGSLYDYLRFEFGTPLAGQVPPEPIAVPFWSELFAWGEGSLTERSLLSRIVTSYWEGWALGRGDRAARLAAKEDGWAWEAVHDAATEGDVAEALTLLTALAEAARGDEALAAVGAGPLEHLLPRLAPSDAPLLARALGDSAPLAIAARFAWIAGHADPAIIAVINRYPGRV